MGLGRKADPLFWDLDTETIFLQLCRWKGNGWLILTPFAAAESLAYYLCALEQRQHPRGPVGDA